MKDFRGKILEPIVAIILIMVLTLAEFLVVGMQIVSYAIENIEVTNVNNVLFNAMLLDGNGEERNFLETSINSENMKLRLAVKVEKEGYFNGEIHIDNSNFILKNDVESEYINSVSENSVVLNQITAGEEVVLDFGIQPVKPEQYKLEFLNKITDISIYGTYVMGKNSEKEVNATKQVQLKLNPEDSNEVELNAEVVTNKIYKISDEDKRIVQVEVTSKLQNSTYPIKNTRFRVNALEGAEDVTISKRETYATNNDYRDIEFNKYENEIEIEIVNTEENGTIQWNKNGNDKVLITYIFPQEIDISNAQIHVDDEIELYDENNSIVNSQADVVVAEEKDGAISYELQGQDELYKGYLYYGEESTIETKSIVDIRIKDVATAVKVAEGNVRYTNESVASIRYYSSKVDKEKARKILGDSGRIEIKSEAGILLGTINRETIEQTESDKVEINYEGQNGIVIEIHDVASEGRLEFDNYIILQENAELKGQLKNFSQLKVEGTLTTDKNISSKQSEKTIELKEPETYAKFTSNTNTLSTLQTNENVEFNVILKTDDIKYDLYKNPIVEIQFPEGVTNIEASFNGVFLDNLQVRNASIYDIANGKKAMRVELEGEQLSHSSNLSEGIILNINANIDLSRLASTKDAEIKMLYINENSNGNVYEQTLPIKIKSKEGLLVYNKVENFNDNGDILETEEPEILSETLYEDSQGKEVIASTALVNNYSDEIKNVTIIGKNVDDTTIDLNILKNININKESKISYSENGEDWTDNANEIEEVKAYKIETETIESSETIALNYEFKIPDELDYNQMAKLEQSVSYEYQGQELNQVFGLKLQTENIELVEASNSINELLVGTSSTDEVTGELEVSTTTKLAAKDLNEQDTVFEGETLTNVITISNKTGNDLNNVVVKVNQENAVIYDLKEKEVINYDVSDNPYIEHAYDELETGEKTFNTISELKSGEIISLQYEVVVNQVEGDDETTYGQIEVSAQDINTINHKTIENKIKQAELKLNSRFQLNEEVEIYSDYIAKTMVNIENIDNEELKNIEVKIQLSGLNFADIESEEDIGDYIGFYNEESEELDDKITDLKYEEATKTITFIINELAENEKMIVTINTLGDKISLGEDEATMGIIATATTENNNVYNSNLTLRKMLQTIKNMEVIQQIDIEQGRTLKHDDNFNIKLTVNNKENIENTFRIEDFIDETFVINSIKVKTGDKTQELDYKYYEDSLFEYDTKIDAKSTMEFDINVTVDASEVDEEDEIINIATIYFYGTQYDPISSNEITFNVEEYDDDDDDDDNDNNGEYTITGTAWLDKNKDGRMNSTEEKLNGVEVKLVNKNTGEIINNTQTNQSGNYSFKVENNEYIVVFLYDTQKYNTTEYKKSGVSENENSDAISKNITIDNEETLVGITDTIVVLDENIRGINIGLIEKEIFDLRLDKYVSKISVQSQGETYVKEYEKEQLAKLEIGAKYYDGAFVAIEYQINITNEGEIDGYASDIVDYLPAGLKFSSELNKDWYMASDGNIHNISLESQKIASGETKSLSLVLTKTLSDSDGGLMSNTAEIYKCSNNQNIADSDSTPGNKATGEDDISTAGVIISISTGIVKISLIIIFTILVLTGVILIIIKRKEATINE